MIPMISLTSAECREVAKALARNIDYSRIWSKTEASYSVADGELEVKGYYTDGEYYITEAKCLTEDNEVVNIVESSLTAIEQEVARI